MVVGIKAKVLRFSGLVLRYLRFTNSITVITEKRLRHPTFNKEAVA